MTYVIIIILIILSAFFSGLTLGLMSLNSYELKRKMALGDADAKRIYPVRRHGNLLLTTLLVGNVAVNAVLSIFLGTITSGVLAAVIATALIVVFGEIIPQASFSRYAMQLGAKFAWLVHVLIYAFYPICKPIAWVLDKVLGEELPTVYTKQELVKIIEEHEDDAQSEVDADEERIIKGALTFSDKKVESNMTPRTVLLALQRDRVVDDALITEVSQSGFSRFPIYIDELDDVIGILHASQLLGKEVFGKLIGDIVEPGVHTVNESESLDDALELMLKERQHMCIVRDEFGGVTGVITLEDILEEILKTEIMDERDVHEDMRTYARQAAQSA